MTGWDGRSEVTPPIRAGVQTMTTVTSGVAVSAAITFVPPFAPGVVPAVTEGVTSTSPGVNVPSHSAVTNTGFTLRLVRNATGASIDVSWQAIEPTQ